MTTIFWACYHQTFDCPVGVWVIEQRAIILSVTVRSPTVYTVNSSPSSAAYMR